MTLLLNIEFLRLCAFNYFETIKLIIVSGIDMNFKLPYENVCTPSDFSYTYPHNGTENYLDTSGITALMIACRTYNDDLVDLLLKNGADVNNVNDDGNNALMYCKGPYNVQQLLDKNVNVNHVNKRGYNALMYMLDIPLRAFTSRILNVIQKLITHGCDLDFTNENGTSVRDMIRTHPHVKSIDKMVNEYELYLLK